MLSTLAVGLWGERVGDIARLPQGDLKSTPLRTGHHSGAEASGLTHTQPLELRGETTCDGYLNGAAYWRSIPAKV
jgi:hypothetical protein